MRFSRALINFLVGYALLHLVVAAIFLFVMTSWLKSQLIEQTRDRMQDLGYSLREHVQSLPLGMQQPELLRHLQNLQRKTNARLTLINDAGIVRFDSSTGQQDIGYHGDRPEIKEARASGVGFQRRDSTTLELPLFYLAIPLFDEGEDPGSRENGFVRVAFEEQRVFDTIRSFQRFLALFTIGSGLLAGLLMVVFASREMRPLPRFADAARSVASGQYVMLPGLAQRDDEWKSLADAFSVMQSELRQRETRLRENSQRLEAVLGSMVEGVLAVDPANRVLVVNQAASRLLGYPVNQLLNKPLLETVRLPELGQAIQRTLATELETQTEFDTLTTPRRTLEVRVAPMLDQKEFGATIVMHDVTDLRNLETMRRDFVANVSHELKTPLAAIKAYAETLRLGALDDQENNVAFVQQIEEQAEVLDAQIADLLKLAELESGKSTFDLTHVDLASVFQKCHQRFQVEADRRDLQILIEVPEQGCRLVTDRSALRTILDNLVSNAIRYARPSGVVKLTAEAVDQGVCIQVSDNGIGISDEHRERIFERFYRVDKARSRDLGGTGLGLAIVKHTVNALGGRIRVQSKLGQGSTFIVTLPDRDLPDEL